MQEVIMEVIWEIIGVAVVGIAGLSARMLAKWLNRQEWFEALLEKEELAAMAVRFVEQVYKDSSGKDKYKHAKQWLTAQIQRRGLDLQESELEGLIEAAVSEFKQGWSDKIEN